MAEARREVFSRKTLGSLAFSVDAWPWPTSSASSIPWLNSDYRLEIYIRSLRKQRTNESIKLLTGMQDYLAPVLATENSRARKGHKTGTPSSP